MIDQPAIEARQQYRSDLDRLIAQFEAKRGPIQTLPIMSGDRKHPFRISCPERKAQAHEKSVETRRR
jgi:hypothetical protein